jgi:lactoylglutathione lyase
MRMYEVAHIGLVVKDSGRSGRFYRDVLGCQPAGAYEDERVKIAFLKAGTQIIELVQYQAGEKEPRRAGIVDHLAFKVGDIDAAIAKLREKGVTLLFDAPRTALGDKKIFFFAGPDGERLEFIQEAAL